MTLSIMTISITIREETLSKIMLCWVSLTRMLFMLSVTNKPFMLSLLMLNVVMMNVVMLSVVAPLTIVKMSVTYSKSGFYDKFCWVFVCFISQSMCCLCWVYYCYAGCLSTKCLSAKCHGTKNGLSKWVFIINFAECLYA